MKFADANELVRASSETAADRHMGDRSKTRADGYVANGSETGATNQIQDNNDIAASSKTTANSHIAASSETRADSHIGNGSKAGDDSETTADSHIAAGSETRADRHIGDDSETGVDIEAGAGSGAEFVCGVGVEALSDGELVERLSVLGRRRSRLEALLAETEAELGRRVGRARRRSHGSRAARRVSASGHRGGSP